CRFLSRYKHAIRYPANGRNEFGDELEQLGSNHNGLVFPWQHIQIGALHADPQVAIGLIVESPKNRFEGVFQFRKGVVTDDPGIWIVSFLGLLWQTSETIRNSLSQRKLQHRVPGAFEYSIDLLNARLRLCAMRMLQSAIGKNVVEGTRPKWKIHEVRYNEITFVSVVGEHPVRGLDSFQFDIETHREKAAFGGAHHPAAPTTTDIKKEVSGDRFYRNVGNGIAFELVDDRHIKPAVGTSNPLLHKRVNGCRLRTTGGHSCREGL